MKRFAKKVNGWKPLTIFTKTLRLKCLAGFWKHLCIRSQSLTKGLIKKIMMGLFSEISQPFNGRGLYLIETSPAYRNQSMDCFLYNKDIHHEIS